MQRNLQKYQRLTIPSGDSQASLPRHFQDPRECNRQRERDISLRSVDGKRLPNVLMRVGSPQKGRVPRWRNAAIGCRRGHVTISRASLGRNSPMESERFGASRNVRFPSSILHTTIEPPQRYDVPPTNNATCLSAPRFSAALTSGAHAVPTTIC
jgi:hypothetical protein